MTLPDANLLLYADHSGAAKHERARTWWENLLNGGAPVLLAWTVVLDFLRISTSRAFARPLTIAEAARIADTWISWPSTRIVHPGHRHWTILRSLVTENRCAGNLLTDAHLAALALGHNATLCSTDHDFSRFPTLRWTNPLKP